MLNAQISVNGKIQAFNMHTIALIGSYSAKTLAHSVREEKSAMNVEVTAETPLKPINV